MRRMFLCAVVMALFIVGIRIVYAAESSPKIGAPMAPAQISKAGDILNKVVLAEVECQKVTTYKTALRATRGRLRVGEKFKMVNFVSDRPVVLCGFRESDQTWHTVEVHVHVVAHEGERAYTYTPVTRGYTVDRLSGRGTSRLIFDLADASGEHIVVYRTKHLDVPQQAIDRKLPGEELLELATVQAYTPYHPDFANPELVDIGMRYLKGAILSAMDELRQAGVSSKTFPDQLLADVIPWEIPMTLAAIEQMDDEKWAADASGATESVYIEYALNRENSFRFSVSSANAVGATQFTDKNGNGTYSLVVRECRGADLDPRFPEGAENLHNALKAEICLLDMELATLPDVRDLYERKPLIGGIYPVAAYNGGHRWAVELQNTIERLGIDLEGDTVELPDGLVREEPVTVAPSKGKKRARITLKKKIKNSQTAKYVQKYVSVINFLAERADR